jgi:hypothetical protein
VTGPASSQHPEEEQKSPEDRLNGPGWNDWCYLDSAKTTAPGAWRGDDIIDTTESHRYARDGWHRVICTRLYRRNGATLDDLELDGRMAWFHLRLTRKETASLLWSASVAGLADRRPTKPDNFADVLARGDLTWICTDTATKDNLYVEPQRGAGAGDILKHVRPSTATAKAASGAFAAVAAGITAFITQGALENSDALLYSTTGLLVAAVALAALVARAALREQQTLRAMIDAWERGKGYRRKRAQFEHMAMRSPIPWLLVALMAAAALAAGVYLWHDRGKISDTWEQPGNTTAIAVAAAVAVAYTILEVRAHVKRRAFHAEKGLRANPPDRERDVVRPLHPC